ncbi:ABC transporter ATP-binding protein [candidate division KSB1 bacterium]|nr:ABC transporter ATP-binding protein [bacterium]NUM64333.1 ABC transporter ATP-binding protein [candidate division KSB1 bacterium]
MIETRNLIKRYNGVAVLHLPHLQVKRGESFGLVGNNGAGKTTFFSLILDLIEASEGAVLSKGIAVKQSEHWKRYTGAYLDERFLIDYLTPEEYFDFVCRLYDLPPARYAAFLDRFQDFFNGEILGQHKYIREFSRGNQKKIGIAAALLAQPEVLILDEPFPHLDPTTVLRLLRMLKDFHLQQQATVLISSHDLNHVTEVCERIAILEKGVIIHDLQRDDATLATLQAYFTRQMTDE